MRDNLSRIQQRQRATLMEFYRHHSYLRWRWTWFGWLCGKLGIPLRYFPVRWIGAWRAE